MLFRETVAVYYDDHTEHTNQVRTSLGTHYISATKSSRLMLFKETVVIKYEPHWEHITYPLQSPAG
jgi:hypothetical protein